MMSSESLLDLIQSNLLLVFGWWSTPPRSHSLCELPENTFCSIVQATKKNVNTSTDPVGTSLITRWTLYHWSQLLELSDLDKFPSIIFLPIKVLLPIKLLVGWTNLTQRILWETISKTFLQAKGSTPRALQKPTKLVRSSQKTVRLVRHSLN